MDFYRFKTSFFFFSFTYYLTAHYTYYVIDLPSLLPDLSATITLNVWYNSQVRPITLQCRSGVIKDYECVFTNPIHTIIHEGLLRFFEPTPSSSS